MFFYDSYNRRIMDLKGSDCSWFPFMSQLVNVVATHYSTSCSNSQQMPLFHQPFPLKVNRQWLIYWITQHQNFMNPTLVHMVHFLGALAKVLLLSNIDRLISSQWPKQHSTRQSCHHWLFMKSLTLSSLPLLWSMTSITKLFYFLPEVYDTAESLL